MSFSAHSWFQLPSDSTVEVFEYLAIGAVLFKPPALGSSHLVDQLAFYPVTTCTNPVHHRVCTGQTAHSVLKSVCSIPNSLLESHTATLYWWNKLYSEGGTG